MQRQTSQIERLPATTTVGRVTLRVTDLERSLAFYRNVLGYQVEQMGDDRVRLRPGGDTVWHFELRVVRGAQRANRRAAGLYHAAILLPDRADLARVVVQLHEHGIPFGHSDHGVSEALYLDDPDGNGIEVYVDRPREQWPWTGDRVEMVLDPIDFEDLLTERSGEDDRWRGVPAGTTIGHVHLRVSDLRAARRFYVDLLGFDVMQDSLPGALFVSAGGYHHHLGLNVWESRGRTLAPEDAAGLEKFSVMLPDREGIAAIRARLSDADVPYQELDGGIDVRDTDGIAIQITTVE